MTTYRGTVLQVPTGEKAGLLFVDGRQVPFEVAQMWSSPVAPAINQTVDVDLDEQGLPVCIAVVDPQQLAKEKLGHFAGFAGESGQQAVGQGKVAFDRVRHRMGIARMVLAIVLFIAWFALPALSVNAGFGGTRSFSVSEILGINISQGDVASTFSFWSFLGLIAVLLPWLAPWLSSRWTSRLNVAPLLMLIVAFLRVRLQIHSLVSQAITSAGQFGGAQASVMVQQMADEMSRQFSSAITYGIGLWLVAAASLALAFIGLRGYRRALTQA